MWSLAGNLAVDQPIQQFVLGTRKRGLQLLWLGTRVSAAGGSSFFGFGKLSSGFVLGVRSL